MLEAGDPTATAAGAPPAVRRLPMTAREEGFFSVEVPGARAGTRYRFARDGGPPTPDPASRWQPAGVHGERQIEQHVAVAVVRLDVAHLEQRSHVRSGGSPR